MKCLITFILSPNNNQGYLITSAARKSKDRNNVRHIISNVPLNSLLSYLQLCLCARRPDPDPARSARRLDPNSAHSVSFVGSGSKFQNIIGSRSGLRYLVASGSGFRYLVEFGSGFKIWSDEELVRTSN